MTKTTKASPTNPVKPLRPEIVQSYLDSIEEKMMDVITEASIDRNKNAISPIYSLYRERSKYLFTLHKDGKIDYTLYMNLCATGYVDMKLTSYWEKPGYDNLCCICCAGYKLEKGVMCFCRVPTKYLGAMGGKPCNLCGCKGCCN
ncbi:bud site selection protein 31 [Pancytospora epiphaga]|nr:bud site selection protein 31 [Pancytospora epiphaga]